MTLRRRFLLYLSLVFGAMVALSGYHFMTEPGSARWIMIAVESALLALFVFGVKHVNRVFAPIEMVSESTRMLREEDFTTRIREVGQNELDQLIQVYNRLSDRLREQRTQNRERQYFLEKILKVTPSGIMTFDYDYRLESINPGAERLLGLKAVEVLGLPISGFGTEHAAALADLGVGQSCVLVQGRRRLKATRSQYLDQGFFKDFMLIDELTEELRSAERSAYAKLIRTISHEINNSLGAADSLMTSCLAYAPQIQDADRADFENALHVASSRIQHLQTFVSAYAKVVKLPEPVKTNTSIQHLVERIVVLMSAPCRARDIQLTFNAPVESPLVEVDPDQIEQVLINIIKNAIEAVDRNGWIRVTLNRNLGGLALTIEDSGPGFSKQTAASLFTPFHTTKRDGQGIGLTLVSEILHKHGLDYGLESQPDCATRFTIWF